MPVLVRSSIAAVAILTASSLAIAQNAAGLHPRPTPADYATSRQSKLATYAASVIPADQVRHLFAVDISKTYVVLEVACYPGQPGAVTLDPTDFLIKTVKTGEFVRPADSVTVAAVMQDKNTPRPPTIRTTQVYTEASIGYESGTDPVTGRREHGTYTEGGVGVGNGPNAPPYPGPPPPGATPQDRMLLEQQLGERALPPGPVNAPVAGYLYFPLNSLKKSNGSYALQYLADGSGKVQLQVPLKSR